MIYNIISILKIVTKFKIKLEAYIKFKLKYSLASHKNFGTT